MTLIACAFVCFRFATVLKLESVSLLPIASQLFAVVVAGTVTIFVVVRLTLSIVSDVIGIIEFFRRRSGSD